MVHTQAEMDVTDRSPLDRGVCVVREWMDSQILPLEELFHPSVLYDV